MKNFQVIDGALNSTFEVFQVSDNLFEVMFPNGTDVAFIADVEKRFKEQGADESIWNQVYRRRVDKKKLKGIHGTLHLIGSPCYKDFFPTRKEADVKQEFRRSAALVEFYLQHLQNAASGLALLFSRLDRREKGKVLRSMGKSEQKLKKVRERLGQQK